MIKTSTLITLFIIGLYTGASAQQSRVIAQAAYVYDTSQASMFIVTDSITFQYTGNRGGSGGDIVKFSTSNFYHNTPADTFRNTLLDQQTFDNNNNALSFLEQYWDTLQHQWVNSVQQTDAYNASNNDTFTTFAKWNTLTNQWVPTGHYYTSYSGNKILYSLYQRYDTASSQYINNRIDSNVYTPAGNVASYNYLYWDTTRHIWFNFSSSNWNYNSANLAYAFEELVYDTAHAQWDTSYTARNYYNADSTENFSIFFGSTVADTLELDLFQYDARKNGIYSQTLNYNGGWDSGTIGRYSFNTYNQLTSIEIEQFTNNVYTPSGLTYFYYGLYTGIPQLPADENNIQLYPNPSNNIVNVNATLPAEEPVTLTLYNLLGQPVWSLNMGRAKRIQAMVPVNNLPAGLYTLTVQQSSYLQNRKVMVVR